MSDEPNVKDVEAVIARVRAVLDASPANHASRTFALCVLAIHEAIADGCPSKDEAMWVFEMAWESVLSR